ncbi:MAG: sigma-54-dependent Fis family transcriptional regulator [Deltaproteobacteria bacterium]|nr:sigma-54-dependent Fis family transcriptional regulator [Deltaproteobacteria bacterium]
MDNKKNVLLVDDEEVFLEQLKETLKASHPEFRIDTAEDGVSALEKLSKSYYDIVLTDIKMPRMDGITLLKEIRSRYPSTYVVMITAFGSVSSAVEAMKYGAYDFLEKPFNMDTLELSLAKIIKQQEILEENIRLKGQVQRHAQGIDQIVGAHPKMQKVYEQIITAADIDLPVLIMGETGTGKELVARSIHSRSERKGKPFVIINCAAVPENLLESEFFGHEKGAFSGAIAQRIGKFEKAHTGTLFLDEIGDIPLGLQAKILRVLQDGCITRLGSNKEIKLDFRVICATNRPIEEMIKEKLFREDLYYRINIFPIWVPPLRQRVQDIPLLVNHFITKYRKRLNPNLKGVSPEVMDQLMNYPWPGNVRELENVVQRAMVSTSAEVIERIPFLGAGLENSKDTLSTPQISIEGREDTTYKNLKQSILEQFEKRYFSSLLNKHSGVIAAAAREAGLNYKTFYLKLRKYGLLKKR